MMYGIPIVSAADLWARDQEENRQPLIRRESRVQGRKISFHEELLQAAARTKDERPLRMLELH